MEKVDVIIPAYRPGKNLPVFWMHFAARVIP